MTQTLTSLISHIQHAKGRLDQLHMECSPDMQTLLKQAYTALEEFETYNIEEIRKELERGT